MDDLDLKIRSFLQKRRHSDVDTGISRLSFSPDTDEICRYLKDELKGTALERMIEHLKNSPEDQELVIQARQILEETPAEASVRVPKAWIQNAKQAAFSKKEIYCPHCGKGITPFKKPVSEQKKLNVLWLTLAVAAFFGSFVVKRYFMQCLLASILFGVKWIVDEKMARTQILIYKALEQESDSGHSRLHEHHSNL